MSSGSTTFRVAAIVSVLFGSAVLGFGQAVQGVIDTGEPARAIEPTKSIESTNTYGTSSFIVQNVSSFSFVPFDSTTVYTGDGSNGRFATSGTTSFEATLNLPNGAVVDHLELEACDTATSANVDSVIFVCYLGICSTYGSVSSSGSAGCGLFNSTPAPLVVNNQFKSYTVQVSSPGATARFKAVRVYYKLQVSPGPAVASFADVPTTSGIFKFVEALVSAGVTAGCGGGNYCPNDPVTRGQMAVFLSAALGLHFPN